MTVAFDGVPSPWRDARAAESARLESVCGATHRGFESHSLRHGDPTDDATADDAAMQSRSTRPGAALDHGDVPVGAVVRPRRRGHRRPPQRARAAPATRPPTPRCSPCATPPPRVGHWRLDDCTLVVTLEPCVDVRRRAWSTPASAGSCTAPTDPKAGAVGSLYDIARRPPAQPPPAGRPAASWPTSAATCCGAFFADRRRHREPRPLACPTGRMPERTNGTASKAVEVLRASVGSNPTPSAHQGLCDSRLFADVRKSPASGPDRSPAFISRRLRASGDHTPVLMLTARDTISDRVTGGRTPAAQSAAATGA